MRVSPYRSVVSDNGAVVSSSGSRLGRVNQWAGSWNGNLFAPPPADSVLYLPGHPGVGSTITDFSRSFSDSGINTNEALDDSELDVDVDADPTSVISTGDVIRVEDEFMYVTSSAQPILVLRGWDGSHAVEHTTGKDIYVRTKNDGTIDGATWRRLPSGLWVLSFDNSNDSVDYSSAANLGNENVYSSEFWFKTNDVTDLQAVFAQGKSGNDTPRILFYILGSAITFAHRDDASTQMDIPYSISNDIWYHAVGARRAVDSWELIVNGISRGTSSTNVGTTTLDTFKYGRWEGVSFQWPMNGLIALLRIYIGGALSVPEAASHYNQERHLFGV